MLLVIDGNMNFYISLTMGGNSDIGLYDFAKSAGLPDLSSGMALAVFHE